MVLVLDQVPLYVRLLVEKMGFWSGAALLRATCVSKNRTVNIAQRSAVHLCGIWVKIV